MNEVLSDCTLHKQIHVLHYVQGKANKNSKSLVCHIIMKEISKSINITIDRLTGISRG